MALTVSDAGRWMEWYPEASQRVRKQIDCVLDVRVGLTADEAVDIFPAKNNGSPVLIYLHGGYWTWGTNKHFSFVARGLVKHGITVVVANYSLCPKVSIDEITRQCRAAVAWVYQNIHGYNGDPEQIFVMGHSAGGQQVGMLLSTDWQDEYGLTVNVVKGGISISGIFDLRPLHYSYLQPKLLLTHETILRQSPYLNVPDSAPPLLLTFGQDETSEFHRQTTDFLQLWYAHRLTGELFVQENKHHYSAIQGLNDSSSILCKHVKNFMEQIRMP
jgi:arylformamidase